MLNKKGAIELSMTTIIVIVIGVTLLILGLVFVRGVFGGLKDISDSTLGKAKSLLGEGLEDVNKFLTLSPESIVIAQGKDDAVKVIIFNQDEKETKVTATSSTVGNDPKLECKFLDSDKTTSNSYTLSSGEKKSLVLLVKDNQGSLRTTGCNVVVSGAPAGVDNQVSLLVRVGKKE